MRWDQWDDTVCARLLDEKQIWNIIASKRSIITIKYSSGIRLESRKWVIIRKLEIQMALGTPEIFPACTFGYSIYLGLGIRQNEF